MSLPPASLHWRVKHDRIFHDNLHNRPAYTFGIHKRQQQGYNAAPHPHNRGVRYNGGLLMYITVDIIIKAAALLGAIGGIWAAAYKIIKWLQK